MARSVCLSSALLRSRSPRWRSTCSPARYVCNEQYRLSFTRPAGGASPPTWPTTALRRLKTGSPDSERAWTAIVRGFQRVLGQEAASSSARPAAVLH
jgi:hypothetical protein